MSINLRTIVSDECFVMAESSLAEKEKTTQTLVSS